MRSFRILSVVMILAMVIGQASFIPASAQGPIPDLAPAYLNDIGQLESIGPEPTVAATGQEPQPTKKAGPIKVGFTPTAMNTHYQVVINGAKTAIEELGGASVIDMIVQAPTSQSGSAEQMNIVEGWIQQGFDAIAVCSSNDQGMSPIYKKAAEKGIPVFLFNEPDPYHLNPYFVSSVGYDQDEASRIMGLWLVEQVRRQGNQPGHPRRPARHPQHHPPARLPQGDRRSPQHQDRRLAAGRLGP